MPAAALKFVFHTIISPRPRPKKALLAARLTCCIAMITSAALCLAGGQTLAASDQRSTARQLILIIGDGMDDQQLSIARNYLKGAHGKLLLDEMPIRSSMQILTIEDAVNGAVEYVSDSANTATSMATGAVTSIGRISTSAGDDRDIPTIVELAAAAGYKTGLVSTASVTDATPAAFASHINFRLCESPAAMIDIRYRDIPLGDCRGDLRSAGGAGSISEQLINSPLDLLLGGGARHFAPLVEDQSQTVAARAETNGFRVVYNSSELQAATGARRLLGLFAAGTMPVRLRGEGGRGAEAPRPSLLHRLHPYLGSVTLPTVMNCEPNPAAASVPSLQVMTESALANLSADNPRGFFLMIESASIDKESHERRPCGSIGEVQQLEEALVTVLRFAETHANTLVLVTADHSQAAQLVPEQSMYAAYPVPVYSPGMLARIRTPEGSIMGVNYATNNFSYEEHTGATVPLYGNSEASGRVSGFIQQPQIFTIAREYLGL